MVWELSHSNRTFIARATMSEIPPYPPIDPTTYDLIVIGTGLPESLIAAAASSAGKTVLHLDPNTFYGSHFSSLSLSDLSSFLTSNSTPSPPQNSSASDSDDFSVVELVTRPLYSSVEISNLSPDVLEVHARKFNVDVSGPRVMFCAEKSIDLMLKSGASQYVEFKSIDASFIGDQSGKLSSVPDSRSAIFKDKSISLMEKNQLMRFYKRVQDHVASSNGDDSSRISEEDLDSNFVDFLTKMRLPPKIKLIILYAIAMVDFDQENTEDSQNILKTRHGIEKLALYSSSVGRFSNSLGAMIYPIYGQGELPQAFCRRAAVKGCLYVLRMPVTALLLDKDTRHYRGVRLASGQDIFSQKVVIDPSLTVPMPSSMSDRVEESFRVFSVRNDNAKVARGICITGSSMKADISNILVVYPPRSLFPEQHTAIRVLQIGSSLAICPAGMYVLYLSALCDDADQGKKLIQAAMDVLFTHTVSEKPESDETGNNEVKEEKPSLHWSALYIQELTRGQFGVISSTSMPDGKLNYNDTLEESLKLFQQMFPDDEFFPETVSTENSDEDGGLSVET